MKNKLLLIGMAAAVSTQMSAENITEKNKYKNSYFNIEVSGSNSVNTSLNGKNMYSSVNSVGGSTGISIATGREYNNFRTELAYTYKGKFKIDSTVSYYDENFNANDANAHYFGNIDSHTIMLKAYKDFNTGIKNIKTFIGAGVGVAYNQTESIVTTIKGSYLGTNPGIDAVQYSLLEDSKVDLSWQVSLGLGYKVAKNTYFDFGYRYSNMGSFGTRGGSTQSVAKDQDDDPIPSANTVVNISSTQGDLKAHELTMGIRYRF